MKYVLVIQVATFVILGVYFLTRQDWRLGISQILLALVQGIIYSAGLP